MKFGKEFKTHLEETLPEWRDKYLCYKPLKKLLKNIPAADLPKDGDGLAAPLPSAELHDWFVGILNEELEKFNNFYVDKEEEFIIRFQVISWFHVYQYYIVHTIWWVIWSVKLFFILIVFTILTLSKLDK